MIKNSFKKIFTLIIIILTISGCGLHKKNGDLLKQVMSKKQIIAGVKFDSKPFGFIDSDQKVKGFDVDLVREIAARILGDKNAVKFQQVTSSNRIFSLTSGSVDMVAATMTINSKRSQIIDFSMPYYTAGQTIMVPKTSNIKTVKDLNGKRVVVVLGSTSEKNIRELAPKTIIEGFRTYTDAFSALRTGRADALTTDDTIISGFILEDHNYKMLKQRFTKEPYGIGFRKDKDTLGFQRAVNIALENIKADGTLEKIRKKWMNNQ